MIKKSLFSLKIIIKRKNTEKRGFSLRTCIPREQFTLTDANKISVIIEEQFPVKIRNVDLMISFEIVFLTSLL